MNPETLIEPFSTDSDHLDSQVHPVSSGAEIPTAKKISSKQRGLHSWLKYYAGFSPGFVEGVAKFLRLNSETLVYDPFAGSGTTNVVCKSMGIPSIGMELNPVSYLVANAKLAWDLDANDVRNQLHHLQPSWNVRACSDEPDNEQTRDDATHYLFLAAQQVLTLPENMRFFLLASIIEALRNLITIKFGTNPTWQKGRYQLRRTARYAYSILVEICEKRIRDLCHSNLSSSCPACVLYGDSVGFESFFKADAIITSPPYLNRLDYVMSYELENSFLLALEFPTSVSIEELRKNMMGTVKITEETAPDAIWGETCNELMDKVRHHRSKAASCYYYKTMCDYFGCLQRSVQNFYDILEEGGVCCMVVQTSYFKDLEVRLPTIVLEMAEKAGFGYASCVREDSVPNHIGRTDPDQKKWNQAKLLTEKVVLIER